VKSVADSAPGREGPCPPLAEVSSYLIDCPAHAYDMTDMSVTRPSGFTRKRSAVHYNGRKILEAQQTIEVQHVGAKAYTHAVI